MNQNKNKYDLEERTAIFSENIIEFCKTIPITVITKPIINQLIRSGTSVGANYMEANGASSKKDFKNKIYICKKEISETKYWLRMITKALPETREKTVIFYRESQELTLIFQKIINSLNNKNIENCEIDTFIEN